MPDLTAIERDEAVVSILSAADIDYLTREEQSEIHRLVKHRVPLYMRYFLAVEADRVTLGDEVRAARKALLEDTDGPA